MKRLITLTLTTICLVTSVTLAQPQRQRPEAGTTPARQQDRRRSNDTPKTPAEGRPLQQWLNGMQENNPERHKELMQMRQEDPEAFARNVRENIGQRRMERIHERHPALRDFLDTLPAEQRDALIEDLQRAYRPERIQRQRAQTTTAAPPEATHQADLETFDAQTRHFETAIERAEMRLQKLRELLEQRQQLREKRQDR